MAVYHLTATVWQEDDQYVSRCPELGVASCGDTTDLPFARHTTSLLLAHLFRSFPGPSLLPHGAETPCLTSLKP